MSGSLSKTTSENASTDIRTEKSTIRGVNHVVVNGGKAVSERVAMSDKMQGTVSMKNYENQGKEIVVKPYTIANKADGKAQVIQKSATIAETIAYASFVNGKIQKGFVLSAKVYQMCSCAREVANDSRFNSLSTYSTHTESHIKAVVVASVDVAAKFSGNDSKTVMYTKIGALTHDLGMSALPANGRDLSDGSLKNFESGKQIRKEHSVNSGVEILRNSHLFKEMGLNPGVLSMANAFHSKSNSGVTDIDNIAQWKELSVKIEKVCISTGIASDPQVAYGIAEMKAFFSTDSIGDICVASGKEEEFEMMQVVAKSVTIGDFLSHTYGTGEGNETQTGDSFNILNTSISYDVNQVIDMISSIGDRYERYSEMSNDLHDNQPPMQAIETIGTTVQYVSPDGEILQTRVMDGEMLDAAFPLGEQNISIDFIPDSYSEKCDMYITVKDAMKYPESTIFCGIMERVMELPRLNIPVDVYIDVGNTNVGTGEKIELAESIRDAVQNVFLCNLNGSENEDFYTSQINFK